MPNVLTAATIDGTILGAAAVYADTCSLTLSAVSPRHSLWDAIPRDIDTVRNWSRPRIADYCERLVGDARLFSEEIRRLLRDNKLVVIDSIKDEVRGQRGRTNGLALRAEQRFPFAPSDLVRRCLSFQMAVHDHALAAHTPQIERTLLEQLMKRINAWWREEHARGRKSEVSLTDKQLFAAAAANAIMLENGAQPYGDVVLISRDFNHVFRMYHYREELLRPVCQRLRLLYPHNFVFRSCFRQVRV